MDTRDTINNFNAKIDEARNNIRKIENEIIRPNESEKERIAYKFLNIINNRENAYHVFEDAYFTENGITLYINADHRNDCHYTDFTWDEIEKIAPNLCSM